MKITSGWYILLLNQIGNVGAHQINRIKEQPKEGFPTEANAIRELEKLIENKGTHWYPWDAFTISRLWTVQDEEEEKYKKISMNILTP
jgi:hypothetical protein